MYLKICGVDCTHFAQNVSDVFKRLYLIFGAQKISKTCWVKNNSAPRSTILQNVLLFSENYLEARLLISRECLHFICQTEVADIFSMVPTIVRYLILSFLIHSFRDRVPIKYTFVSDLKLRTPSTTYLRNKYFHHPKNLSSMCLRLMSVLLPAGAKYWQDVAN